MVLWRGSERGCGRGRGFKEVKKKGRDADQEIIMGKGDSFLF
jgi:hypothetical protein